MSVERDIDSIYARIAELKAERSALKEQLERLQGQRAQATVCGGASSISANSTAAANAPLTVMNHPSGRHGFDSFENEGDEERSKQIVRSSIEFMTTHLGLA
jgi:hypothetical protein